MSAISEPRHSDRRVLIWVLVLCIPLAMVTMILLPNAGLIFRLFHVPSGAMIPNVPPNSYVLASRASYGYSRYSFDFVELPISGRWPEGMPARGDVVVFRRPRDRSTIWIKRVIGLPGDRVQMVQGRLSINGQLVAREPTKKVRYPDMPAGKEEVATYVERLADGTWYRIIEIQGDTGPYDNTGVFVVPPGHLFMLGDNRDNSTDSRMDSRMPTGLGYVPVDHVIGRVIATFGAGSD